MEPSTATIAEENEDLLGMEGDPDELGVKVVKLTDSTIQLDWSLYTEANGVSYYRYVTVQLHSSGNQCFLNTNNSNRLKLLLCFDIGLYGVLWLSLQSVK